MAVLSEWAQKLCSFPMRRQGELDGACGLYCIVAIGTWWVDSGAAKVADPEETGYLAGALPGDQFNARVLSDRGLDYRARRRIAANLGLDLRVPQGGFTRRRIIDHFETNDAPLLATTKMKFHDPLARFTSSMERHAIVVVSARAQGLLIADPHPWNGPGSPTELNGLRGQRMWLNPGVIPPRKVVPERLES